MHNLLQGASLGIEQHRVFSHWNYFLSIEEDVSKLARWVELSERNFDCYSLEIARLLMTTSAEVDVVAKLVCKGINPQSKADSIFKYQAELTSEFPNIHIAKVAIPRHGLELTPWSNWQQEKSPPLWWQANNKVKHRRSEHFHEATLKNLLNSVAALQLLLVLHYGPEIRNLHQMSKLFSPKSFCVWFGDHFEFMPGA